MVREMDAAAAASSTVGVTPDKSEIETLNSLLTKSIVGDGSFLYYVAGSRESH